MLRESSHFVGEIRRGRARLDQMGNARRRVESNPIDEICVFPQRRVRPYCHQMSAKRGLCIGMLRVGYRLRNICGLANVSAVQCANEDIESLLRWQARGDTQRDPRPMSGTAALHNET